jgi:hypothetical protein
MVSLVTSTIGLAVAAMIIVLVRRDRLHVNHGLGWLAIAVCFAVFGVFPQLFDYLATALGVAYPPVLGLTGALALLVIKVLVMDIERSRIETRNQRLIQRIAMLEGELKELRRKGESAS